MDSTSIPSHPRESQENFRDSVRFLKHFFLLPEDTNNKQLQIITLLFGNGHNFSTVIPVTKQLYSSKKASLINTQEGIAFSLSLFKGGKSEGWDVLGLLLLNLFFLIHAES